jgi:hypothetical protein
VGEGGWFVDLLLSSTDRGVLLQAVAVFALLYRPARRSQLLQIVRTVPSPEMPSGISRAERQVAACVPDIGSDDNKDVLVVGAGNSAAQLAVELAASRRITGAAPGGMWFLPARILGVSLYWWLWLTGILNGPSGSRISRMVQARGDGITHRRSRAGGSTVASEGHVPAKPERDVAVVCDRDEAGRCQQ